MIEDAQRIFNYLPLAYKTPNESEYISFLWDAFVVNYEKEKYQFAYIAYHMLFMSFIYFKIWQIRENHNDDFAKAMVGFNKDTEAELLKATTPFSFWLINESSVFRFLKLIDMDNAAVGEFTKLVKGRNQSAHSNGNVFFRSLNEIDKKIDEILRCVEKIQKFSSSVLITCVEAFLLKSTNPEENEYFEASDQVREVFIKRNYLSLDDIYKIESYQLERLKENPQFPFIEKLFNEIQDCAPFIDSDLLIEVAGDAVRDALETAEWDEKNRILKFEWLPWGTEIVLTRAELESCLFNLAEEIFNINVPENAFWKDQDYSNELRQQVDVVLSDFEGRLADYLPEQPFDPAFHAQVIEQREKARNAVVPSFD
jgi:hypothetical protein